MVIEYNFLMLIREHMSSPFMDSVMIFLSSIGDAGFIWIVLGIGLIAFKATRKCGMVLMISLLAGYVIGNVGLKNIFDRIRPYEAYNVQIIIPHLHDFSFPSGHTLSSFIGAFSIFAFYRKWGRAAMVLAGLIAFSRMYLFVHYPSDILGGIILAVFVVCAVFKIYERAELKIRETC